MTTATSCRDWRIRVDGRLYTTLPYGTERIWLVEDDDEAWDDDVSDELDDDHGTAEDDDWENNDWDDDDSDLTVIWGRFPNTPNSRPLQRTHSGPAEPNVPDRCGDCHVSRGHPHHPGCDLMECPVCHRQIISCGCWDGDTVAPAAETFRAPRYPGRIPSLGR